MPMRFLVLEMEIEMKLSDIAIRTDEKTLDVKAEQTIEDLVVVILAATSHDGVVLVKNTKVEQSSEANGEYNVSESDIKNKDEVKTKLPSSSQISSNQPSSVIIDKTESGLIIQMRKLFKLIELK